MSVTAHGGTRQPAATLPRRSDGLGMKSAILAAACVLATPLPGQAVPTSATFGQQLSLPSGTIRTGDRDAQGVLAFKGIPYAAPPVGKLRWRSPMLAAPWQGVRDATAFGLRCWAPALGGPAQLNTPAGEDCLTVNVWTGARAAGEKRPVMVWIHGGGFQFGASGEANTNGVELASKGAVLVSFNYRLGVFGFLSHPALDAEGSPSGDFGLQDQIAALKWVQANIAQFGGDPANVTIFGESAGAMSVGLLMASPLAKGLFAKAICESGAFWDSEHGSLETRVEAQARGKALADRLAHGSIAALRSVPAEVLGKETAWGFRVDPVSQAFSPNVDGYVLPTSPAQAFADGYATEVPLLAGRNGAEGKIFAGAGLPHGNATEFRSSAAARFGKTRMAQFLKAYPSDTDAAATAASEQMIGDLRVSEQVWDLQRLHSRSGAAPTYGYQFNYRSAYAPLPIHGAEIDFVFGTLKPQMMAPTASTEVRDREVADQMTSYWVNFARTGNPNGPGLPSWPTYAVNNPHVMVFDAAGTAAGQETGTAGLRFIESYRKDGRLPAAWRADWH